MSPSNPNSLNRISWLLEQTRQTRVVQNRGRVVQLIGGVCRSP